MDSHAPQKDGVIGSNYKVKLTYQDIFYRPMKPRERERDGANLRLPNHQGAMVQLPTQAIPTTDLRTSDVRIAQENSNANPSTIYGFPYTVVGGWCHRFKEDYFKAEIKRLFSDTPQQQGAETNTVVQFLGIAADEPERIERHSKKPNIKLPLVEVGWTEADCRKWCEENDLLSPIYTTATRGGCWFCHNQGIEQMRLLRKNYPQLWELLLKWDLDSPVTFKADGHTVHDFDERFTLEDEDKVPKDRTFRWWMVEDAKNNDQLTFDDL